jgi:MFS superfamily sulfate permease-like transporter
MLSRYRGEGLRADAGAGLSVAAVALPIAYAQLAGFQPVGRLYASILLLVVYAVSDSSSHTPGIDMMPKPQQMPARDH